MNLYESFLEPCALMLPQRTTDGEGGYTDVWTEGTQFPAAIVLDNSMLARVAEREDVRDLYTVTTRRNVTLAFPAVIKRLRDGATFRVTSDGEDKRSPDYGTLDMRQVSAEKWSLT